MKKVSYWLIIYFVFILTSCQTNDTQKVCDDPIDCMKGTWYFFDADSIYVEYIFNENKFATFDEEVYLYPPKEYVVADNILFVKNQIDEKEPLANILHCGYDSLILEILEKNMTIRLARYRFIPEVLKETLIPSQIYSDNVKGFLVRSEQAKIIAGHISRGFFEDSINIEYFEEIEVRKDVP